MPIQHGDILLRQGVIFGQNGDLAHGDAQEQFLGAILNSNNGNFRAYPTLGANLSERINGVNDSRAISAAVQNALFLDGWRLVNLNIETSQAGTGITIREAVKVTDNTESLT